VTQESTQRRAASLEPADLWVIGEYRAAGGRVDYPLSAADVERDAAWAAGLLAEHGLAAGGKALLVSAGWESPWTGPLMAAIRSLGAGICFAEIWGWDAARVDMFVRRLESAVVVGLTDEVAAALGAIAPLDERLAGAAVLARPDARGRLAGAGLRPALLDYVGPMTAVECPARQGAHVNGAEWALSAVEGGLEVRAVGPRAHRPDGVRLAVAAELDEGPCGCGRRGPRLRLDAPGPGAGGDR
jgi:hypothetical protein